MKNKKILVIVMAFMIMLITGCGNKGYKEISYNKLKEMVNNKETFALFIGKESCSSCTTFKGVLNNLYAKEYAKEATIYYIDTDKLSDDEFREFNATYSYSGTPTVTIIVEGKFTPINSVTGSNGYNDMVDLMKSKGLLKGEVSNNKEEEKEEEKENNEQTLEGYKEISYTDLKAKVNNKETFALFIGKSSCGACTIFKSILNNNYASKYASKATIYYVDTDKLTDSEYAEFNNTYAYEVTPTVAILVNGKFSKDNTVSGTNGFSDMIEIMKKQGLL